MPLHDILLRVAETYDPGAPPSNEEPAQLLLRGVSRRDDLPLPPGFTADGHGGQGTASSTPWIGVYDPAISAEPHNGLYLAYIFSADLRAVTLTLQQGMTGLIKRFPKRPALRDELARRAKRLRGAFPPGLASEWMHQPSFYAKEWRPRAYEAGSVAARRYEIARLPSEVSLAEDLLEASKLLRDAAAAQRLYLQMPDPADLIVEYPGDGHSLEGPLDRFHPKDSSEYYVHVTGGRRPRRRLHEDLIQDFGHHAVTCGYTPITDGVHPRDLILCRREVSRESTWLVEAKVVRNGNPTAAVREAVGQLFEYSYLIYRKRGEPKPHLLALFTEGIGVYEEYLEDHGVASVWQDEGEWRGSETATSWGLARKN